MFDVEFARAHFPALTDDWALFDNAGGTPPLGGVIDRIRDYASRWQVQLGATYQHSAAAAALVAEGRRAMARLVNAEPDEIVLGPSSTANVRVLSRALRPLLSTGDEVVVTNLDHETNIGAWRELENESVRIREWRFDPERLELTLEGLEPLLGARTRLVCFTHCSNIVGTIHDAAAIIRRAHEAGALTCVDGVAYAPHRRVDVKALDADFYFLSPYKVYGPHLGMLYGKRRLLRELRGQNHFFIPEGEVPSKFEPGGVVHELAAALPAILDYLLALDERHFAAAPCPKRSGSSGSSTRSPGTRRRWPRRCSSSSVSAGACASSAAPRPTRPSAHRRSRSSWTDGIRARSPRAWTRRGSRSATAISMRTARSLRSGCCRGTGWCGRAWCTTTRRRRSGA